MSLIINPNLQIYWVQPISSVKPKINLVRNETEMLSLKFGVTFEMAHTTNMKNWEFKYGMQPVVGSVYVQ